VRGCTFVGNDAGSGGGAWFEGDSSPVVSDCRFESNRVVGLGGGLSIDLGVELSVTGSSFVGNVAGSGGGIAVSAARACLSQSEVLDNTATFGGGICLLSSIGCEIVGADIESNTADAFGGGIYCSDGTYTVSASSIAGNSAVDCGGAFWLLASEGLVTRTAVTDNSAGGLAGGFFIDGSPTTIASCEILGNGLAVHVVASSRALADARLNWWGDPTGPYHRTLNPSGLGDEVGDSVQFTPWNVVAGAPGPPEVVRATWGAIKAIHR